MAQKRYSRIVLKLSGESFASRSGEGLDLQALSYLATEIIAAWSSKISLAVVVGGGNLVRGKSLADSGIDRVTGDHMGMLATLVNALALQDALEKSGAEVRVLSALQANDFCEVYIRRRALRHLEKGRIVIFGAGTGNPFFTTDTAASLRATEMNAELLLKATKVDGVYDSDPVKDPGARLYRRVSYDRVLADHLEIMDATAIVMCRENGIPVRVFNIFEPGEIGKIVRGEEVGTLVTEEQADA